jgi:ABC-2 type transport system permease protein
MRDLITIFRRELASYFNSAIAYIFLIVFAMVTCGVYMLSFFLVGRAEMRSFFSILPMMLVVFVPAITMRLWAEDRKSGTYELLLTFPMKTLHIVLGKFFASFAFYLLALATTFVIPIMLARLGEPDLGPILGGYFGSMLCGAFFISVGLFVSGLCKDQIVAFVVAMMACFVFLMLGMPFVAAQVDGWTGPLQLGTRVLSFIAMTKHFESVERGLIDARDIIYFVAMTGLFLGLNAHYLDSRMRPRTRSRFAANIVVYVALVIFLNVVVSGFTSGRIDLTEEKIYTVSPEAKKVIADLKVPVKINFYISPAEKMPSLMKNFEQEVVDKLREFEIASDGNLKFQIHHVEAVDALSIQKRELRERVSKQIGDEAADKLLGESPEQKESEGEKLAQQLMRKGVEPFQVQSIEADERSTVSIYSAISIAYKEKDEEVIPQLHPRNFMDFEYDLVSRIFRLTRDEKPLVAVVASKDQMEEQLRQMLQRRGMQTPPAQDKYSFLEQVLQSEDYDARRIRFAEKQSIPDDADTVVIVNPSRWGERQRWELNRALHSGKSVILAVQSYVHNYNQGARGIEVNNQDEAPGVNELLEQYGIGVNKDILMDLQNETLSVSGGKRVGPFQVSTPVKLPTHILLTMKSANADVSITSNLSSILYLWGTTLNLDEVELKENGLEHTVLLKSGEQSWTVPFRMGTLQSTDIETPSEFDGGKPLTVLIEGQFPDTFKGKERPKWPELARNPQMPAPPEEPEEQAKILPAKPGRLLLTGCAVMWQDSFLQSGGNLPFFVNSVDALTLGDELIHIRTKTKIDRVIPKVSANKRLWYRFFTMGLAPLCFAVFGMIRLWLRRRTKETYLREVTSA